KMERGTDTGSQTLIDATVAMAASSRLAYLVSYFANPGGDWQGALIKYSGVSPGRTLGQSPQRHAPAQDAEGLRPCLPGGQRSVPDLLPGVHRPGNAVRDQGGPSVNARFPGWHVEHPAHRRGSRTRALDEAR